MNKLYKSFLLWVGSKGPAFFWILGLIAILILLFLHFRFDGRSSLAGKISATPSSINQASNSGSLQAEPNPKQVQEYYDTYKNPYVIYIRKALDSYLAGNNVGINDIAIKSDTVHSDQNGDTLSGLDSFSKDYYKSKFIVVNFAAGIGGGKVISIEFQDKPDKVFDVWIYQLAGGDYELRGFSENKILSGEKLIELNKTLKTFLEDKAHSL